MTTLRLTLMVLPLLLGTLSSKAQQNISRQYKPLGVNSVEAWFSNDARNFQTKDDGPGFLYPAKTSRAAIFMAGY